MKTKKRVHGFALIELLVVLGLWRRLQKGKNPTPHPQPRQDPREELNGWYRNRRLDWDETKDGAFWGHRGRRGARM